MDYPVLALGQFRPVLRSFRRAKKMTQAQVAELMGITQQSYAKIEAAPEKASVERLFRVLQILQVKLVLTPRSASADLVAPLHLPAGEDW
jgi:HTH-type transcriptional regulator/antitoxin HipB